MDKKDLSEFFRQKQSKRCALAALEMNDEQRKKLNAALEFSNADISNATIVQVLHEWGFRVGRTVVGEHRRGACCCHD